MTTDEQAKIDAMNRVELARRWRFAPVGDPLLSGDTGDYFKARLDALGGFSPAISKEIGWDR